MDSHWLLPLLIFSAAVQSDQRRSAEPVKASHVFFDLRVLDRDDRLLTSLEADDFEVRIDGKRALVDSVRWVGATPAGSNGSAIAPGRLFLFLVQKNLENSP